MLACGCQRPHAKPIEVVYEKHASSQANERGVATGRQTRVASGAVGRANAADMGWRRRGDGVAAVFTSDQRRAAETTEIAFDDTLRRWAARRRAQLASDDLRLTVGHVDLLALPR